MNGLMMDVKLSITSIMEHAERVNGSTEIVSVTGDNQRHRYTYKEAFARARQLANGMSAWGLAQGDRIGTLAWNDYRHFETYYASACSGYVCHTVNPRLFPEQLVYIINHADDQYLFVEKDDPTQGVGIFGRFGYSDGTANPIQRFYSFGVGGKGIVRPRPVLATSGRSPPALTPAG